MYRRILAGFALVGAASAQNSTATLLLVGFDQQSILGSVIGSDSTATTYALNCNSQDDSDCGIPPSFTFTQGPSTIHYVYSFQGEDDGAGARAETIDLGCEITSSEGGSCSVTMNGNVGSSSTSSVNTTSFSNIRAEVSDMVVTITAGAVASPPNSPNTASSTATTREGSSTKGSTASESSSSSTAGAPMVTKGPWIVGGAAAVLGYAAM